MFDADQYELIEFGDGTKIERFGSNVVARESPSVELFDPKVALEEFEVDASFDSREGPDCRWHGDIETDWHVSHGSKNFRLRQTPTGQIGLFPEQATNWKWIESHSEKISGKKAINLFAYTGGSLSLIHI